jgi:hypothetical protein
VRGMRGTVRRTPHVTSCFTRFTDIVPMDVCGGVGVVCAGEQASSSATFSFLTARRGGSVDVVGSAGGLSLPIVRRQLGAFFTER